MTRKSGTSLRDKAKRAGAPQTREEVERMIERAAPSPIMTMAQRWLEVDRELEHTLRQSDHVRHELGDRVLGELLRGRANDMILTLKRRATELTRLEAITPADIGVKVYVITQISKLDADSDVVTGLCSSIRRDVDTLDIDVERLSQRGVH